MEEELALQSIRVVSCCWAVCPFLSLRMCVDLGTLTPLSRCGAVIGIEPRVDRALAAFWNVAYRVGFSSRRQECGVGDGGSVGLK